MAASWKVLVLQSVISDSSAVTGGRTLGKVFFLDVIDHHSLEELPVYDYFTVAFLSLLVKCQHRNRQL